MTRRRVLFAVAVVVLAVGGVTTGLVVGRGGSAAPAADPVLVRISGESACSVLQREFDNAAVIADNRRQVGDGPARQQAIGWMEAANGRMRQVGCYG